MNKINSRYSEQFFFFTLTQLGSEDQDFSNRMFSIVFNDVKQFIYQIGIKRIPSYIYNEIYLISRSVLYLFLIYSK